MSAQAAWARSDAEEREYARGLTNPAHLELSDGTCVVCGEAWQCSTSQLEWSEGVAIIKRRIVRVHRQWSLPSWFFRT